MFHAHLDTDPKKPAREKLNDAIVRYREKHHREPRICLTSAVDAEELKLPHRRWPDPLPVEVRARAYMSRWQFFVGQDADDRLVEVPA